MKESKAIVLRGKGSRGKTTTLNILIENLLPLSSKIIRQSKNDGTDDRWIVLEYMGKTIGITTKGDDKKSLEEFFACNKELCDICVCASRTRGSSYRYIIDTFYDSIIMWQEKWGVTEWSGTTLALKDLQDNANKKQAAALIDAIDALL